VISERTILEDIRIMRSNILGFNTPIMQWDGYYYFEDRDYSIFHVIIQDSEEMDTLSPMKGSRPFEIRESMNSSGIHWSKILELI
jgi:hypothetical protein